ncbi:hypothetical protein [Paludisphaera mucosa]|uniref:Tetratricopeptide repeat protein n=1 Tax=Paludisphaera mucosa TaxID=3030827 RepID=A0ABT6FKB4_9BACT|nr:hypothetical protein [Paludisphaera mucosa]MDG3007798.1 hypothetical protein [Paludisphaera mucosa]
MDRSRSWRNVGLTAVGLAAAGFALRVAGLVGAADGVAEVADADPQQRLPVIRRLVREGPPAGRPELLRRFAELDGGEGLATELLLATIDLDPAGADAMLEAYRGLFPDSPFLSTWTIEARLKQGRVDEAVQIHREAAAKVSDEVVRRGLLDQFTRQMADAGRAPEAYAAVETRDAEYVFRLLAGRLEPGAGYGPERLKPEEASTLRALVAAHEARIGRSPSVVYHLGRADEGEGRDEAAQGLYGEAMRALVAAGCGPGPAVDADWDRIRNRRINCLFRLGRWEQAYDECEPTKATFDRLCQLLEEAGRVDDVEKLAARHRRRAPDDPALAFWEAAVRWSRGEYAEALPLLDDYLRRAEPPRERARAAMDRKFRSLVHLGRLDEARAMVAPAAVRRWPEQALWGMIVAAKAGDEAALGLLMAEYADTRSTDGAYADEDLGPLLRDGPFAAVREKFPPPAP